MKKLVFYITIIFFLITSTAINTSIAYAWDDCSYGQVNDQYPGDCPRYVDTDNDGICDHSQPAPEDRIAIENNDKNNVTYEIDEISENTGNINKNYNLNLLSTILIMSYFISFVLSRINKITVVIHRKIWNLLLTGSFIGVAISGVLLIINITYNLNLSYMTNILFIHVETGIIFSLIAAFHILWHLPYYKQLFKIK